jgi:hypothetical protein
MNRRAVPKLPLDPIDTMGPMHQTQSSAERLIWD